MNFFFGHTHDLSIEQASQVQTNWLTKTIFTDYQDRISTHVEPGFSLTLVNDPKKLCPYQSKSIYVDENFVCATDCQLFNKIDLAEKLGLDSNVSNEEFFISAFLKWGDEFPDQFDGKFSFIIWDRKNKTLLAGLDALGYGNFSYSKINEEFYFSSDLATLLDQPRVDKSINMKRFYQCFRYSNNTPEQTNYQHCHYCAPSHVLRVERNQVETVDYWGLIDKTFPENKKDEATNTEEFISLLREALIKETQDNQKLGLMLSGGYDSSLLAAILAENSDWKANLTCYSYIFDEFKSCDESKYIQQTLEQLNLKGKQLLSDDKTVFSDIGTRLITRDIINMDAYNPLLESLYSKAHHDNKTIMISGLNGDDIFAGVRYMFADLIKKRKYRTIIKSILHANNVFTQVNKFLNFGIRPLLPNWVKVFYRRLFTSKTSPNEFNINTEDINSVDSEKLLAKCKLFQKQKLMTLIYYRNLPEGLHFMRKRLYLKYELEHLMPYYNKKIIEFMWTLPIEHLEKKGVFRGIQINALNLFRLSHVSDRLEADKTSFVELIERGVNKNKHEIQKMMNSSFLKEASLINKRNLTNLTNKIDRKKSSLPITYFILAELWYKSICNNQNSFNHEYIK